MKGTTIMILNVVFLLMLCDFFVRYMRLGEGFGSKAYHMLLLGWLKLDLGLAHAEEYGHLAMERLFRGYRYSAIKANLVHAKEQRLLDYKKQMSEQANGYKRKEKYNRKIPG